MFSAHSKGHQEMRAGTDIPAGSGCGNNGTVGRLRQHASVPRGLESEGRVRCQRVWFREKGVFLVYRWHGPLHAGLTGAERTPVLPHL